MTELLLLMVVPLTLLLTMTLGGASPTADANEERARKSLRCALGGLISSGLTKARIARLAADELDELRLITKGAN
jgi:hypothetical protein